MPVKMIKLRLLACAALALVLALSGCGERDEPGDSAPVGEPLYAETVSPNQNYVEDEKDVVRYTVQIYQDADGTISVRADSNSAFFEQLSYDVPYHRTITEENIRVEWLTLAGGTEPTESDQIALARVTISDGGEVISRRNINFFSKGIQTIIDTLPQK